MAIEFTCPACGGMLRVAGDTAGRVVRCGGCMSMLRVPEAAANRDTDPSTPPRQPSEPFPLATQPRRSVLEPEDTEPTRPPKPRGVRSWLVLLLGVLAGGLCVCCLGIIALMPTPNWQRHDSGPGGFSVEFPADPKPGLSAPGIKADAETKVLGARLWGHEEVFAVGYQEVPAPGKRPADDLYLAAQVKLVETNPAVRRTLRNDPVTVSGFPAREVEFLATNGGTYVLRVVIADTRAYRLVAGGKSVRSGDENVRRFLDSFAITDAKLLAAAKELADQRRREEQARLVAAGKVVAATAYRSADTELTRVVTVARQVANLHAAGTRVAELMLAAVRQAQALPIAPSPREKSTPPDESDV